MFGFVLDCVKLARGVLGLGYIGETASLSCRGLNQLLLSLCVFLSACCRRLCKRRRIWLADFGFPRSCGRDRVRVCMPFFRHMVFNLRLEPLPEQVYYHNKFHNFFHNLFTWQIVSGKNKMIGPCGSIIPPLTSCHVTKL